jgi:hypothetical protein
MHDELFQLILEQALDAADQAAHEVLTNGHNFDADTPVSDLVAGLAALA